MSKITEKRVYIPNPNLDGSELYAKITELEAEIQELKRQQQNLLAARTIIVERLYVRRVDVKELQFKLDKITVDDLSGMLNVGVNSDGKMKKH